MFEREDWTLFRSLGTLGQKAGVPVRHLPKLVIKELADNALDAGAQVTLMSDSEGCTVEDDGAGLIPAGMPPQAAAEFICRLFSMNRPLISSKLLRRPSRGALGNGLRVVVGAVFATQGRLEIATNGLYFDLEPQADGTTRLRSPVSASPKTSGTKIRVVLPDSGNFEGNPLAWARVSILFSQSGEMYVGKTSAWWYDDAAFLELIRAANAMPVAHLVGQFRSRAPKLDDLPPVCSDFSPEQARLLMTRLRGAESCPHPKILGKMGRMPEMAYAHEGGYVEIGQGARARLPYAIEVHARTLADGEDDTISFIVNRTMVVGDVRVQRQKAHQLGIIGCGISHLVNVGRKPVRLIVSITTPYMPITTDGKEPDLFVFVHPLFRCIEKSARGAKRKDRQENGSGLTQREVIATVLDAAIDQASGNGRYRYSLRQLFYAVRPHLLTALEKEPEYNYFAQVITDIEAGMGRDLPGLYRDARGVIYHPHTREEIPLGTLNVETYERPAWTFNKILYSEKEGFFSILKDAGWPERNDCALLTSKGFASRAARDVLDLIGESQEEIYFFCIHDADASGTLIYQALTEATRARGKRKVHVINLGLEPWEADSMGLQVETFRKAEDRKRDLPVAEYIDEEWKEWLQTRRVELNAMSSPQFLSWLDGKFDQYRSKVVPPQAVLNAALDTASEKAVRDALARKLLAEAGFEAQVLRIMEGLKGMNGHRDLEARVAQWLSSNPRDRWDRPVEQIARELAGEALDD